MSHRQAGTRKPMSTGVAEYQWKKGDAVVIVHLQKDFGLSHLCASCNQPIVKGEQNFRYVINRDNTLRVIREHPQCKSRVPDRSKGVFLRVHRTSK